MGKRSHKCVSDERCKNLHKTHSGRTLYFCNVVPNHLYIGLISVAIGDNRVIKEAIIFYLLLFIYQIIYIFMRLLDATEQI